MRWPGKIPAGAICSKLSSTIDLMPTLAEISGGKKPAKKIDGVNILPLLLNDTSADPRKEFVYYFHKNDLEAIRKGKWKLVFPHQGVSYAAKAPGQNGYPQFPPAVKVEMALYDLSIDPGETVDVQASYPGKVNELKALADKYRRELGDDLTNRPCTECRPAASFRSKTPVPARFR